MAVEDLTSYGWSEDWEARLGDVAQAQPRRHLWPARVVRHHGVAVDVVTEAGVVTVPLRRGLKHAPVVGDWVAVTGEPSAPAAPRLPEHVTLVDILPRATLLERRMARGSRQRPLVANIDQVLITCGLDRPINAGRIQRSAAIAWEAGATPAIVVTKADLLASPDAVAATADAVSHEHPGLAVLVTSSIERTGLDRLREAIGRATVALLGESGSGKSSLVNALSDDVVAATGEVRERDRKGRHTTTSRELYALAGGGVVVDTPGLRALGVGVDEDSVEATFDDIAELAEACRFRDCAHDREPACAVRAAVEDNRLDPRRLEAFHRLGQEAAEGRAGQL